MNLRGQTAMVTGGGSGIGRIIALALAGAGAKVAVVGRTTKSLTATVTAINSSLGNDSIAIKADVTQRHEVVGAVEQITSKLGAISLLVNCAGTARGIGPLWEIDPDVWWRDVEVSLRGTLLCCHAVLPGMIAARQGRIINVASAAASMTLPMSTSYACAKAGVVRLTDGLAASVKDYGVQIFAISPGPTRTPMTEHILESVEGRKWMPEFQKIPENAWTAPEKIGSLVVSLASGQADVLSGRFIHIKTELTDLVARANEIQEKDLYTLRIRE